MMNGQLMMNNPDTSHHRHPLISVKDITHHYGSKIAVDNISFDIQHGEVVSLLGPSGCGKTTMLRLLAGFEQPVNGIITKKEEQLSAPDFLLSPEFRKMGLVFQSYALFPHLTVAQNVAFGLKAENAETREHVRHLLQMLDVEQFAAHYPHALSGGQQQRVAIARALAPSPDLILLDEPFSGLDSRLREHVRDNILHILKSQNIAALMVTHDAEEAMFMSDRIIVMREGRVMQAGRPIDLYCRPQNAFVAEFFGEVNKIPAQSVADGKVQCVFGELEASQIKAQQDAVILLRQEGINLHTQKQTAVQGEVMSTHMLGRNTLVHLSVDKPEEGLHLHLHARLPGLNYLEAGQQVYIEIDPAQAFIFSEEAKF